MRAPKSACAGATHSTTGGCRHGQGQERTDHGAAEHPTRYVSLLARRSFVGDAVLGGELIYHRASDAAAAQGNLEDYAWWMGRLYLSMPF